MVIPQFALFFLFLLQFVNEWDLDLLNLKFFGNSVHEFVDGALMFNGLETKGKW